MDFIECLIGDKDSLTCLLKDVFKINYFKL